MLSFVETKHNLSGLQEIRLPHLKDKSKESIFRLLLQRGSLSVEAALVLPLFLFSLMTLLSCLQLLNFSQSLQQVLFQEGLYLSEISYDKGSLSINEIERDIKNKIQKNTFSENSIPIDGGIDGLDFGKSKTSNPELTEITVKYTARLVFDPFKVFSRECCQYVTFHNWVGYINGINGFEGTGSEIYVYITEDSEVYHRDRDCTHIRLNITKVSVGEIKKLRNEYGEKYTSCSHCKAKLKDGTLYITKDGNCYHNSLQCSGLSRTVTAIPLSEVGGRRPCMRCGY